MKVTKYASGEPQVGAALTTVDADHPQTSLQFPGLFRRHAAVGPMLYWSSEPRYLYIVETGALSYRAQSTEDGYDIIEYAFTGYRAAFGKRHSVLDSC